MNSKAFSCTKEIWRVAKEPKRALETIPGEPGSSTCKLEGRSRCHVGAEMPASVLPSAALLHIPTAQSDVLSITAPQRLRLFRLPKHSPEMFHQLLERHRQGSEIWDGKAHFMHAKMLCFALHSPLPPQLGDLGLGQPRCLPSPRDQPWMQHRIAGSEGWEYGTAPG